MELSFYGLGYFGIIRVWLWYVYIEGPMSDWWNWLHNDGLLLDVIVELLMEGVIEGETIFSVSWCRMFRWHGIFFFVEVWEGCLVHYLQPVLKELEYVKILLVVTNVGRKDTFDSLHSQVLRWNSKVPWHERERERFLLRIIIIYMMKQYEEILDTSHTPQCKVGHYADLVKFSLV